MQIQTDIKLQSSNQTLIRDIINLTDSFDQALNETEKILKSVEQKINLISASMLMGLPNFYISAAAEEILAKFKSIGGSYKVINYSDEKAAAKFFCNESSINAKCSFEDVRKSGICHGSDKKLKPEWRYFRKQMLWNLLVNDSIRIIAPQLLITEEKILKPSQVPCGKLKGKYWHELPEATLKASLLSCRQEFTDSHRNEIKKELDNRKTLKTE